MKPRLLVDAEMKEYINSTNFTVAPVGRAPVHDLFVRKYLSNAGRSFWTPRERHVGWSIVEFFEQTRIALGRRFKVGTYPEAWEVVRSSTKNITSPGFPYSVQWQKKSDIDPAYIIKDAERLEECISEADDPSDYFVWQLFAKEELTKRSKIEAGDQRGICCVPYHFLLVQAKYFNSWHMATAVARNRGPYIVGINVHSLEWTLLAYRHNRFRRHVAMDISGFEFTPGGEEWEHFAQLLARLYGPEHHDMILRINRACISKWVRDQCGHVGVVTGMNPSGQFLTTEFNCRCTMAFVMTALYFLCKAKGHRFDHLEDCEYSGYGDDALLSVSLELAEFVSPVEIREFLAAHGVKCKNVDNWEDSLSKVDILSMSFRRHGAYFLPRVVRTEKLTATLSTFHRGATVEQRLQKLVQIRYISAANDELFAKADEACHRYIDKVGDGYIDENSWQASLRMLLPQEVIWASWLRMESGRDTAISQEYDWGKPDELIQLCRF